MLGKKSPQMSFGQLEAEKHIPQGHFLRQIDEHLDWRPFTAALAPLYHPDRGRPGYPPVTLFKALLLQRWYGLSDPGLEEAIRDRLSFQRFLGLALQDSVPDETTICKFRSKLAEAGLMAPLFLLLEEQLAAKDVLVRRGTLIDATLVQAHSKPSTARKPSQDPDAAWVRKGNGHYFFGYKAHLGVDQGSTLVRRLALTPANVPETQVFEEVLPGDSAAVFADKAYEGRPRRAGLRRRGILCGILAKSQKNRPLTPKQKRRNRVWERIRRAIERVIGTHKRHYGLGRFPYVGRWRNLCHLWLVSFCYNLKKMLVLQRACG